MYRNILLKKYFKFFSIAFYLFFFVSNIALAQTRGTQPSIPSNAKLDSEVKSQCTYTGYQVNYVCAKGQYYNCAGSGKNSGLCYAVSEKEAKGETAAGCSIWNFSLSGCFFSIVDVVGGSVLNFINYLLGGLVSVASFIFDFTVYTTIVQFRSNFADLKLNIDGNTTGYGNLGTGIIGSNNGELVYYLWGIIRDILNIIVFLLIIYHAVHSMFEGFEGTKKKFIALLVFSIVVNFSLLFVKLAIDVSNILALQAYTLAVKPSGTADFSQFRTSSDGGVKSYGEYIMSSIDLNELLKSQVGIDINTAEATKGLQSTFMFQLGRMIVYVGLIYILIYMSGVLIARAVSFLFAMLAAPLIAADVFFELVGKDASGKMQDVIGEIKHFTQKIKDDFYEALLKGPLLIFMVFLIGVFAEGIVGKGMIGQISSSVSNLPEMKNLDDSLTRSFFVFFKFAIFLALTHFLFTKLNEATSFAGSSGRLNKWGRGIANATFGRGLSGVGWVGRNTVGRGTSALKLDNTFSKWATNATKQLETNKGFLNRNFNRAKLTLAEQGLKRNKSLKEGSYDIRTPLSKGGLGNLIKSAAGVDVAKDLGKIETRGFSKIEEEKAKERKDREDKRTDEIKSFIGDLEDELDSKKAKFSGQEYDLGTMKKILDDSSKQTLAMAEKTLSEKGKVTLGGVDFTDKDILKKIYEKNRPDSLDAVYSKEKEDAEKKIVAENKKKFDKSRKLQIEQGNARTVGDYLSFDRYKAVKGMEEKAGEEVVESERKSAKEKAEKIKKQVNYIDGSLTQMSDNVLEQVDKIRKIFPDAIANDDKDLKAIKDFKEVSGNLNAKNDENKKELEQFNKDGKDTLFKAKEELLTKMRSYLNRPNLSAGNIIQLKAIKKQLSDAIEKNKKNKENYEATLSDKKKGDDKKKGGDGDKDKKEMGADNKPKKDETAH